MELQKGTQYRFEITTGTIVIGEFISEDDKGYTVELTEQHHNGDNSVRQIWLAKKTVALIEPFPWSNGAIFRVGTKRQEGR